MAAGLDPRLNPKVKGGRPRVGSVAEEDSARTARERMVQEQIVARGLSDERVLDAMRTVPRHEFIPSASLSKAYVDSPLSIGFGQTISQPYMVAYMSEQLSGFPEGAKVLELGTGSGYQAAVLVKMGFEVHTMERIQELADSARATLDRLGLSPASLNVADGHAGWPSESPYSAIIATACARSIPQEWIEQGEPRGVIIAPIQRRLGRQMLVRMTKRSAGLDTENLCPVRFVPLVDERGGGRLASALGRLLRRRS